MTTLSGYIVPKYKCEDSLLLRYCPIASHERLTLKDFLKVHIREGARIIKFFDYKGVHIYLADESTLMAGGNFKTLEACFTIGYSRKKGYKRIAFSSGANLGSSLTLYGRKAGIETFFFQPKAAAWKLDSRLFEARGSHLIAVDKPEKEVKKAAILFARMAGIKHVPEVEWRYLATGIRALFVFEYMLKKNIRFDWIAQAVCAGYGPIGFYNCAQELIRERIVGKEVIPKFLGIQQAGLMPMVRAWRDRHDHICPADRATRAGDVLSPSLYNTSPDRSYPYLYRHLVRFGGDLISVTKTEYDSHLSLLLEGLARRNIRININGQERILENAGLIGLAGCLKAIDKKIIKKGETMLCFFTGGAGSSRKKIAEPEFEIKRKDDLKSALRRYLNMLNTGGL